MNKHILQGHLGKDPEVKQLDFGTVVNCSLATHNRWKDKQTGEKREATEWHNLQFFGAIAETAAKYLHKGSRVLVCGESRTREYTDKDGITRRAVSVNVKELEMLDKKPAEEQQGQYNGPVPYKQQQQHPVPAGQQAYQSNAGYHQPPRGFDDEVPF